MATHTSKDMPEWRLTLRTKPTEKLDLSALSPKAVSKMSTRQIHRLPLQHGKDKAVLADFFHIEGHQGYNCLHLIGGSPLFYRLGMEMDEGFIILQGDSGNETGLGMSGGHLHVLGQSGHFTGAGMSGGQLLVDRDSGDYAGARRPGYGEGHGNSMSGGLLCIGGNSGDRTGSNLRLGVIAVRGATGDYCANDIHAGTIIALNGTGAMPAIGMRRGTLLLGKRPHSLPAVFNNNGRCELVFFRLLLRGLAESCPWLHFPGSWDILMDRHSGDMSISGKGEVLTPV